MSTNPSVQGANAPGKSTGSQRGRANDDRVRDLIVALGDPNHSLHSVAINELVGIGSPAVGALGAALSADRPWLTSYRAAEALAQIGDGSASGALINAMRHHPNSNVRWSAIRALAEVGDTRTLWALRRVAQDDRGRTSFGESVADAAHSALERLQGRSALLRFSDPIKTTLVFVTMIATLLFAANRVQAVLAELRTEPTAPTIVRGPDAGTVASAETTAAAVTGPTPTATKTTAPTGTSQSSITATAAPTVSTEISGTALQGGNVRSGPSTDSPVIGKIAPRDQIIFLAVDPTGNWYRVRLGTLRGTTSIIQGSGEGWVSRILVNPPPRPVPTERPR